MDSGIPLKESRIPVTIGIRNPSSTDEEGESSTWNPEPTVWNPESKTVFDYLNPFAPGNFAEKRVLKLVEWFSGHCRAVKS